MFMSLPLVLCWVSLDWRGSWISSPPDLFMEDGCPIEFSVSLLYVEINCFLKMDTLDSQFGGPKAAAFSFFKIKLLFV